MEPRVPPLISPQRITPDAGAAHTENSGGKVNPIRGILVYKGDGASGRFGISDHDI
jgi:hypothetical protein